MTHRLDRLVQQYENGAITRRQLLAALTALAVPAATGAQTGGVRARAINHINVGVSNLDRSETFYRTLLALPARRYIVGDAYALDFPDGGFISLCPTGTGNCSFTGASAVPGDLDHFGVGIENFDATQVAERLEAAGFDDVVNAGPTSVLVTDPDGLVVQISAATERFEGTPPARDCWSPSGAPGS